MQKLWGCISSCAGMESPPPHAMRNGKPWLQPSPSVFSLPYSDDASMQSVSQSGLSTCPAVTASFCSKETLEINYFITKLLIFILPPPILTFFMIGKLMIVLLSKLNISVFTSNLLLLRATKLVSSQQLHKKLPMQLSDLPAIKAIIMPSAIKPFKAKVFSHSYMALNLSTLETIQFKAVPTFLDQLHMYFNMAVFPLGLLGFCCLKWEWRQKKCDEFLAQLTFSKKISHVFLNKTDRFWFVEHGLSSP